MRVIALLRGLLRRMVGSTAQPTQSVGPASPEPMTPLGSPYSAEVTSLPPQPAPIQPSPSSEPAPKTTRARRRGNASKAALTQMAQQLTAAGSKSPTPARQTPRPAKPASKAKQKPVSKTKAAPKRTRGRAHAQTRTVNPSGDSGS